MADKNRMNKLIKKAGAVVGLALDSVDIVMDKRMKTKLQTLVSLTDHPLRIEAQFQPEVQKVKLGETLTVKCNIAEESSATDSTLKINDLDYDDAGTYYCGIDNNRFINFSPGTVVEVKGKIKPNQSVIQKPDSIRVKPGNPVRLNCSFDTSDCPEDHISVTWIKNVSASQTDVENIPHCKTRNGGGTSCVYRKTLKGENGIYLCMVTACGNTLLGSGTTVEVLDEKLNPLVIALILVTIAFVGTLLVLMRLMCKNKKKQPTAKAQSQPEFLQATTPGATLHVKCQVYSGSRTVMWYKMDSSRKLHLMASTNRNSKNDIFQHNRYSVQFSESDTTLIVKHVTWEDAGMYYCGVMNDYDVNFAPGTMVVVEGKSKPPTSLLQTVVQSPDYISVQPGDTVTLKCSFTISHCTQDHIRLSWMKVSSPLYMFSRDVGNETMICNEEVPTACVQNLTLTNVRSADDGTYLCVVTACGDTLLGSGSKVHLYVFALSTTVMALIGSNFVLGVFVFVLLQHWVVSTNNRQENPASELQTEDNGSPQVNQEDSVIYTDVNVVSRDATCRISAETAFEEN
ncbi:hypothetical protein WMY93_017265 [Mugilogobius chulae]|uniref:Ig-like domain-containing protein n=1 Tax=Mugilogobius chulae TaxID=88201 RepID=A0AAW0NNW1_9GOBI